MKFTKKACWMISNEMSSLDACFAWLSYLVHSCTNTILLHLFRQSVGVDGYRMSPKRRAWINLPSTSKGILMIQVLPMSRCLFKMM